MMKKAGRISVIASLAVCGVLVACAAPSDATPVTPPPEDVHSHTFATTWTVTETEHYKAATCEHKDVKLDAGAHKYGIGDARYTCTVCGYERSKPPVDPDPPVEPDPPTHVLNGAALYDYTVVYADGNDTARTIAESFAEKAAAYIGVELNVVTDRSKDTGNEIFVGLTSRSTSCKAASGKYSIAATNGDSVQLYSATTSGLIAAARRLADDLADGNADYATAVNDAYDDLGVKIMSYNLRVSNEDRWSRLKQIITRNDPDVLGTQECSPIWQEKLKTDLSDYGYVGEGRSGPNTEACFILYKKSKFDLVDSGTRWLSDTPTVVGSKYAESAYIRIYNYALLERKSDEKRFVMINTHLDISQPARLKSVDALDSFAADNFGDLPVFVTGDFNTDVNEIDTNGTKGELLPYDVDDKFIDKGYLNTRFAATGSTAADRRVHTFPTTMYPGNNLLYSERIIDYCFVKGGLFVDKYRVDNVPPENPGEIAGLGADASDHYPVVVDVTLYKNL